MVYNTLKHITEDNKNLHLLYTAH